MNFGDPLPQVNPKTPLGPEQKFALRCEVRAALWQTDQISLHDAVDDMVPFAKVLGIEVDRAQAIMGRAFAAVRDDLAGWRP